MLSELNEQNEQIVEATQPAEQPVEQEQEQQQAQESSKDQNFRNLRERAERAEQRAKEFEAYYMEQQRQQQKYAQPEPEEDDIPLEDESYVEAKYLKKLKKELRDTKRQIQEINQNTAQTVAEARLRSKYGEEVDRYLTNENLEKLKNLKPSHYRSIMANPDIYDRGETALDMIKAFVTKEKYESIDKKIEENRSKPRSAGAVSGKTSETPLSRISDYDRRILTEERKNQLRLQVEEAKKYR